MASTSIQITEIALDLFSERTYDGTSMRDIASRVGVTPASLYNYYASKEDILWMIVETTWAQLDDEHANESARAETTVELFEAFVRAHTGFHARKPRQTSITNRQLPSLNDRRRRTVRERRRRYERRLADIIATGIDERNFHVIDIRITSFAILEIGMGVSRWFRPSGPVGIEELVGAHVNLALRMVGYEPRKADGRPRELTLDASGQRFVR